MDNTWLKGLSLSSTLSLSLSLFPAAERGHQDSERQGVLHLDPAMPSDLSATFGTRDQDGIKGTDIDPGVGARTWPEGKVFTGSRAAVWTGTEGEVQTAASGKVFTETRIMTGTGVWAEVGAEWRPRDAEKIMPRDSAPGWVQQKQQARGMGQGEQPAFSSVSTTLAETVKLQAPALPKPLGLLSKAAWTRSFSSSLSKTSSSSTKTSLPSSSSPSSLSPASSRESQTPASGNISLVVVNSNTTNSSSSSLGKVLLSSTIETNLIFHLTTSPWTALTLITYWNYVFICPHVLKHVSTFFPKSGFRSGSEPIHPRPCLFFLSKNIPTYKHKQSKRTVTKHYLVHLLRWRHIRHIPWSEQK